MYFHTPDWEMSLFRWINDTWRNPVFDLILPALSATPFLWALAIGAAILAIHRVQAPLALILGLSMVVGASDLACSFIKDGSQRQRPYHYLSSTWYLDGDTWKQRPVEFMPSTSSRSSYPSAHAANSVAAVWIFRAVYRFKAIWFVPLLIGLSRVYLGKHFPMDIVAGGLIGLAVAVALQPIWLTFFNRVRSRWIRYRLRR
ncbi:MAG: phosphatase PAP2 family protein [Deltaproteobacteria bacterium]|nr:phosphatase PAP2 family protein [Deltaproteobacteria bacterium]